MKQNIKKITGWIHATLIFTLLVPAMYAISMSRTVQMERAVYIKGFLILLPVITSSIAISKCRHLLSYLFSSILISAITLVFAYVLAKGMPVVAIRFAYILVIGLETIFVLLDRFLGRLNMKEKEETKEISNPYWQPQYNLLEKPNFALLIYYLVIYIFAKNIASATVCNEAFLSAVIYFFSTLFYEYIDKTQEYLSLNERVCNIPKKRIYGISKMMLRVFLLLAGIVVIVAFLMIPQREYRDIRQWVMERNVSQKEVLQNQKQDTNKNMNPMKELEKKYKAPKTTPLWVKIVTDLIGAFIFALLIFFIIKAILNMSKTFRESYDENGDIIEELEETEDLKAKRVKRFSKEELSEREKTRKQYRRFIRKHKKQAPNPYDTPIEIEKGAGVEDKEETYTIHQMYEQARYGKENP